MEKSRKKVSKKLKIILPIIILLIVIIILLIVIYNIRKDDDETIVQSDSAAIDFDPKEDGELDLSGFSIFYEQYTGDYKASEIASKLEDITIEYIPEMMETIKEYSDEELEQYYSENYTLIKGRYGITEMNDFIEFVQQLQSTNLDFSTWYRLDIDTDIFENMSTKDGYAYVEYEVSFMNDDVIKFSLYVAQSASQKPSYIINIVN